MCGSSKNGCTNEHNSHSNLEAYEFCKNNYITILCMPPHSSHRLQPLDVTFYFSGTDFVIYVVEVWHRSFIHIKLVTVKHQKDHKKHNKNRVDIRKGVNKNNDHKTKSPDSVISKLWRRLRKASLTTIAEERLRNSFTRKLIQTIGQKKIES